MYDRVSVRHEISSDSEAGGEAVEATLRALASMKSVEEIASVLHQPSASVRSHASTCASQKSKASTHKSAKSCQSSGSGTNTASSESSKSASGSAKGSVTNHSTAASASASHSEGKETLVTTSKSKENETSVNDSKKHPYRVEPPPGTSQVEVTVEKPRRSGGLFSCCFRTDEQVIHTNDSHARSTSVKSTNDEKDSELQSQVENKQGDEVADHPVQGLTDYERAMIERLRELLSLDTSIPTLPTQVELRSRQTPVSLDITNSMLTNSFSVDTRERTTLQTESYTDIGKVYSFNKQGQETHFEIHRAGQPSIQSISEESACPESVSGESNAASAQHHQSSSVVKPSASTSARKSANTSKSFGSRDISLHSKPSLATIKTSGRSVAASLEASRKNSSVKESSTIHSSSKTGSKVSSKKSFSSKTKSSGERELPPRPESHSGVSLNKIPSRVKSAMSKNSEKSKRSNTSSMSNKSGAAVSLKSKMSKEVPREAASLRSETSKELPEEVASLKSSKSFNSMTSKKTVQLKNSQSADSNSTKLSDESSKPVLLPPKPEMNRSRDASETIIPTQSSNPSEHEKEDGFECIYQLSQDSMFHEDLQQVRSEDYIRHLQAKETRDLRRVASAKPRIGPIESLAQFDHAESNSVIDEDVTDENIPPAARAASRLLEKDPKDIRDDISALSLSPSNPNIIEFHTLNRKRAPRKVDMVDVLSGGMFCCNTDASNAVISP